MNGLYEYISNMEDKRQQTKVKYPLEEIIIIVLFAMLGNANEWEEIEAFAVAHEDCLRKYLALENGIPSHDTIRRVMGMISPASMQGLQEKWNELLSRGEGEKLKKIINIDGKTMRDSGNKHNKPHHVVSAWCKDDGFCLGQTVVHEKSNEITAIPLLLNEIDIKGKVVTIDAMGTQTEIAKQIKTLRGDYVLALKGNHSTLQTDVSDYFADEDFLSRIKARGYFKITKEKAHGQIETRKYYQTDDIKWLQGRANWQGLKTIGMVETVLLKDEATTTERRLYISSLPCDIDLFERAVRGHWAIESMHWHLDVTFREDFNATIDKIAALNLNIMRKFCLSILKLLEVKKTKTSLKLKRFYICCNPERYLAKVLSL